MKIKNLLCEYMKNPIGIDVETPRFSWRMESDRQDTVQSAYEIEVVGLWNSGKCYSAESLHIPYGGERLSPQTRYQVNVRAWDNYGNESPTLTGWFETGKLDTKWQADYIAAPKDIENESVRFVKEISLCGEVASARIYASAYGIYDIEINESKITDTFFSPGYTAYGKRVQYQTFDVTHLLTERNLLSITVCDGWCFFRNKRSVPKRAAIMELYIEYKDGRKELVCTDKTWQVSSCPVEYATFYGGETYNATKKDVNIVSPVEVLTYDKEKLCGISAEPVRVTDTVKPVMLMTTPEGDVVLDFGQNLVGFVEFTVEGKAGDRVVLHHAEILDKNGNFYTENLRSAKQTITYIVQGGKPETYHPTFSFQGFRYVRIAEYPGEIKLENFPVRILRSDMAETSAFECSNQNLNRLFQNILWGQRGNYLEIPTDCPQRDERIGWTGDTQVFIKTGLRNMQAGAFFTKWLTDLSLEQAEDGGVPETVPSIMRGFPIAAWGDAATICPVAVYEAYGDKQIIEKQFDSMKNWVHYLLNYETLDLPENYLLRCGDWLAIDAPKGERIGKTSPAFIAFSYLLLSLSHIVRVAELLEKKEEHQYYVALYEKLYKIFCTRYMDETGDLKEQTQTAYAIALEFGLAPNKEEYARKLAKLVVENDSHLTTGFCGTPYICHALSSNGQARAAYSLVLQDTFPSWLYTVKLGATTIWEHWDGINEKGEMWDPIMNSFNHYSLGSVGDWLLGVAAGIRMDEPGYKHIRIEPILDSRLSYVKAKQDTLYGTVESAWVQNGDVVTYDVTIPPNTTATVVLGDGEKHEIGSGSYTFINQTKGGEAERV